MTLPSTITIDGPAASGKSTAAALLAQSLGYLYFDTGVMYRAVTWAALNRDLDIDQTEAVSQLAENLHIEVTNNGPDDGRQYTVLVDGLDVTWQIREAAVNEHVSQVSSYPRVRTALTEQQRRIANPGEVVMVGRDIGTVVLPQADLKIYMEASAEERARRRFEECRQRGQHAEFAQILSSILKRDEKDQNNPVSPLKPAEDAIIVNTDDLTIEQTLARLESIVAERNGRQG